MSTTIITNQAAIKFSVKSIIDDLQNDKKAEDISSLLETVYGGIHIFNTWGAEYVFYAEQYITSNVIPQIPNWHAFLPVKPENEIICGFIEKSLTSYEGGCCRLKGSSHTKPEAALRKLRSTLDDAPSFEDYVRFNTSGIDFIFDMYLDTDWKTKEIIHKLGFDLSKPSYNRRSSKHDIGFIRFNIPVRKVSDIIKVIMVNSLSTQTDKISEPRFTGDMGNKVTKSLLKKINVS